MIERIKKYVNSLNLTEQFITLIALVMLVMIVLITFFLNNQVNNFVDMQMYEVIERSQNSVIHRYVQSPGNNPEIFGYSDPSINHYIIDVSTPKSTVFTNLSDNPNPQLMTFLTNAILSQDKTTHNDVLPAYLGSQLYTITEINDSTSLVTTISVTYQNEFKAVLTRTVFYILLVILLVNINIILLWVFSIIAPLKKIRAYIDDLGKKKRIPLDIKRNDEIGDVATALVAMEDEITKQEQAKMEMIHNISHDLKTPITTIKSYAESIKDGIYPYDTLEKSIDVIIENADRLERKAYSLLLLNRMDYLEDLPQDPSSVKMVPLVQTVILNLKVIRPEINIITNIEDLEFHGTDEQWRVCIENLLDNAIRYAVSRIVLTVNDKGLFVFNDGEHMSEDRLSKLFKPYEKGTKGNFGLGLSIVARIANRLGFEAKAKNVESGVVFSIEKIHEKQPKKKQKS